MASFALVLSTLSLVTTNAVTILQYTASSPSPSPVICNDPTGCEITCTGDYSCEITLFDAQSASYLTLTAIGDYALDSSTIYCPDNAECTIDSTGSYSANDMYVYCGTNGICDITGRGSSSLYFSEIYADTSSKLTVTADGGYDSFDTVMYCPRSQPQPSCIARVKSDSSPYFTQGPVMEYTWFYVDSINDVEFQCDANTDWSALFTTSAQTANIFKYYSDTSKEVCKISLDSYSSSDFFGTNSFTCTSKGSNLMSGMQCVSWFTASPTQQPTHEPSSSPTLKPTASPITASPTPQPTVSPIFIPSSSPTQRPTAIPTATTQSPSVDPSKEPTKAPTYFPTLTPTKPPTLTPTASTSAPSKHPTQSPVKAPTNMPTLAPSKYPTLAPTLSTSAPSNIPSVSPSKLPTASPTKSPSAIPTSSPVTETDNDNDNDNAQQEDDINTITTSTMGDLTSNYIFWILLVLTAILLLFAIVWILFLYKHCIKKRRIAGDIHNVAMTQSNSVEGPGTDNTGANTMPPGSSAVMGEIKHGASDSIPSLVGQIPLPDLPDAFHQRVFNDSMDDLKNEEFINNLGPGQNNAIIQDENMNMDVPQHCTECFEYKLGKIYPENGMFYCNECYVHYEPEMDGLPHLMNEEAYEEHQENEPKYEGVLETPGFVPDVEFAD